MSKKKNDPPLHPENEAFLKRLESKPADAATMRSFAYRGSPIIGRVKMHGINQKKSISPEESEPVLLLYTQWRPNFPSNYRCYHAIEAELGIPWRRVRTIVEKSKKR